MTIKLYSIEGNRQKLDGGAMFGNAPKAVWSKWYEPDLDNRIELACRTLLIDYYGTKILCETGIGAFFEPRLAVRYGVQQPDRHLLLENLSKLGFQEEDIDYVILSHLHFDHAGGLLPTYQEIQSGRNDLLFHKAKYIVSREAFVRAQKPHARDKSSFIADLPEKLLNSKRLVLIEAGQTSLLPEFSELKCLFSYGHTPGQLHTLICGQRDKVLFCSDLIPAEAWLHLPMTMGYDRFAEQVIDEKERLYKDALPGEWLLFLTHDIKNCAVQAKRSIDGKIYADEKYENWHGFELQ